MGDPQLRTDHPWCPGELALSNFERLFATQAEQHQRATGKKPVTDEERAVASWFFCNTHYAHGEEGAMDWWGKGFQGGGDLRNREYWTGLFAHGFRPCGTTHSQWSAEMEFLLGHGRGRGLGVTGHNSFEVWLTGGAYGAGRWALLDHDISTVIFDTGGAALLGLADVKRDWKQLTDRKFAPQRQQGCCSRVARTRPRSWQASQRRGSCPPAGTCRRGGWSLKPSRLVELIFRCSHDH